MSLETLDGGRVRVAAEFAPLLRNSGLDTFEKVMTLSGGRVARDFPGRRTVRIELKDQQGIARGFFLKRYETNYLSAGRKLLRLLGWPGAEDEAWREWEMLHEVRAAGVPTATPVAAGWEGAPGRATRSFLMTAEIAGAMEGQMWLQKQDRPGRRDLLLRLAEMARRFHRAGFVHKDFYIGHVLVAPVGMGGEQGLFLIDLQRVIRPRRFRARWIVKDLGAMAYSTLNAGVNGAGLMRAYLAYCGSGQLGPVEKSFARQAMKRVAWLRTRRPKHDG